MKKSLFRNRKNRKTHKKKIGKMNKKNKKITNKHKHKNYRNMNMIIGGMEHGEKKTPDPPSTPQSLERPRLALKLTRTPRRSPELLSTNVAVNAASAASAANAALVSPIKNLFPPPMTFAPFKQMYKRPFKMDSVSYSLSESDKLYKQAIDKRYQLVCSIDLSGYEDRPDLRFQKTGYIFNGNILALRNTPQPITNGFNISIDVKTTFNGRVEYNNPRVLNNDIADVLLECDNENGMSNGGRIVSRSIKHYTGNSITCFAWDKNNPNHFFTMGRGIGPNLNNCLLTKFDYTPPPEPKNFYYTPPGPKIARFVNMAERIFRFAINPNPLMDEIVILDNRLLDNRSQKHFLICRKSDLSPVREFVCKELGEYVPSFIIDSTGNHLIVADTDNQRLQVFQLSVGKQKQKEDKEVEEEEEPPLPGTCVGTIGPPPNRSPDNPYKPFSLALGQMDDLIVTDYINKCVEIFYYNRKSKHISHHIMTIQGAPGETPLGVTADDNGNFFVFYRGRDTSIIKKYQNMIWKIWKYRFHRNM